MKKIYYFGFNPLSKFFILITSNNIKNAHKNLIKYLNKYGIGYFYELEYNTNITEKVTNYVLLNFGIDNEIWFDQGLYSDEVDFIKKIFKAKYIKNILIKNNFDLNEIKYWLLIKIKYII